MEFLPKAVSTGSEWVRLILGLMLVYALFHWSALELGSDRGQAGLVVAAIVVCGTLFVDGPWRREGNSRLHSIGLGRPRSNGLAVSAGICGVLLLVAPVYAVTTGSSLTMTDDWLWLVPGLFAQAGIAEEALFRGFLFSRLRAGRTFWRAATLSMLPFVFVHLTLFATLPFWIALAALGLAIVVSFPMARLFELGGSTIWPPALLHFVVQGAVKVLVVGGESSAAFPIVWMIASAVLPLVVFLFQRRP